MLKNKIYLLFIAVAALFVGLYFFNQKQHRPLKSLPYFDPKSYSKEKVTQHHIIPPFGFINQYNQVVQIKPSIKKYM